jgi:hypothetical protein
MLRANVALGIGLLFVPVLAELVAAGLDQGPGVGLSLLLYWPFHLAFAGLALLLFAALNAQLSRRSGVSVSRGILVGVAFSVVWFTLAFIAVGQLHISRGGLL